MDSFNPYREKVSLHLILSPLSYEKETTAHVLCMYAYTYRTLVGELVRLLFRGRVHCICTGRSGSPGLLVRHDNVEIVLDVLAGFK